jgi:pimeloyl-ACP methyl ester carboxylesterase|tara:strand:+ start:4480 stop:5046 length:567 start_codon:yes stop_codon:yes gene_type:complete
MGHSFGTFVVARACQRSRVAAAVLVDPVSCCLMLPAVISKVLYQLEDRWRELWGLVKAGATGGGASEDTHSRRRGILHPLVSWRHRFDLVTRFTFTLFRDLLVVRELSCAVALSRKFWWYQVCLWVEDMPRRSLVVLQSYDAILDPDAIAAHVLARDAADVVWVEGFQHGELLGPQGYEGTCCAFPKS